MRLSRRWLYWLPIPVLFVVIRTLETGGCSDEPIPLAQVMAEQIEAAGLVAVGQNPSSEERGYFVATRGDARCWGQLLLEPAEPSAEAVAEPTPELEFLCTDDSLEQALELPESADSRSRSQAEACGKGKQDHCVALGLSFERGQHGLRLDPGRFMRLFYEACEGEHAVGCMRMARHYSTRTMLPPDPQLALDLFGRACAGGLVESCTQGLLLGVGSEDSIEPTSLRGLAKDACSLQHADGCNTLGVMRHTGEGGDVDAEGALKAFQVACRLGSEAGCENLERESEP